MNWFLYDRDFRHERVEISENKELVEIFQIMDRWVFISENAPKKFCAFNLIHCTKKKKFLMENFIFVQWLNQRRTWV